MTQPNQAQLSPEDRELASLIAELAPPESTLSADEVLARASRPRQWRTPMVGLALAAAALLTVGLTATDTMRDKGVGGGASVRIEAAAESPTGVRALASGDLVRFDERVLFRTSTDGGGWLIMTEDGSPMTDPVRVDAGRHLPGGTRPLAWRPDDLDARTTSHRYQVLLCPTPVVARDCARDQISLSWSAE